MIGRNEDINNVLDLMLSPEIQLVSITGIGGAGKTSLALAVLEEVTSLDSFFIAWEAVQDARDIPYLIADAMRVQLKGFDLWQALHDTIESKSMLLVLDRISPRS